MALRFARLTRPAIRALAPGEAIAEHGIIAERMTNGDVRYRVKIMVDRQWIHRVIGRESDGTTRHQCEQFIEQARTDSRAGRLNLPTGRKTAQSFSEGADAYLKRLEETGGKNIDRKRRQLELHLKLYFKSHRLDRITDFAVKAYRKKRLDAGAAGGTVNRELATLSHLLKSAARWGWIKKDDVPEIEKAEESQGRIIALTPEQQQALLKAAIADQDPDLWLFVAIGLNTGMRHSEITKLRWENIDYARRRAYLPEAKAGEREQPLTPELVDILQRERGDDSDRQGWVFASRIKGTKEGRRRYFTSQFRRGVERAGFRRDLVTPHVMRHTAITRLVKAGVDIPTIMKVSGHKTVAMVLRYTHVDAVHIDDAAAALGIGIPGTIRQDLDTASDADEPQRLRSAS